MTPPDVDDDIPPYGAVSWDEAQGRSEPHDENALVRERAIAGIERCLRQVLVAIGRDYEACGKAACARSRRCRGFACEAAMEDDDGA